MPRAGQLKPVSDRRLSDLVSVGVIARTFPAAVVDEVIAECGRTEQRARALPARVMAYFAVGMALHADSSYEASLSLITDGLGWVEGTVPPVLPTSSAIFQARQRLGAEPVEALFRRVAAPLATEATPGSCLAGRRMVAIDGTCLDLADTPANDGFFGRPGVNKGERSAFPMARVVAIAECGTHAMFDAVVGPYSIGENTLARELVDRLEPGMLAMADRGFCGFPLWSRAVATGTDLLWRAKANMKPELVEVLDDGSWLATFKPSGNAGRKAAGLPVRVVEFSIDDGRNTGESDVYRLFTTLLDPGEVTAQELALAYAQRWEIEIAFAELKTHQRGPKQVLRSKSPELVFQEIWGHLCCHYAIRTLMWEAAAHHRVDPDRVSFLDTLRIVRRSISAARDFSPSP